MLQSLGAERGSFVSDFNGIVGLTDRVGMAEDPFWRNMGMLMAALAVIGFAPNSVAILTGTMNNPPLIVHVHAATMFAWVAVLASQSILASYGRRDLHQRLGQAAFVLGPAIILMLAWLAVDFFPGGEISNAVIALQSRRVVLFTAFFTWAVLARKSDAASHKRMMFFTTLVVMDAATNRMGWLPQLGFASPFQAGQIYLLALFIPFMVYDFRTLGRLHTTTLTAAILMLVSSLVFIMLI